MAYLLSRNLVDKQVWLLTSESITSSFFSFLASTLMIGELARRPLVLVVALASEVAAASDLGLSLGEMELVL